MTSPGCGEVWDGPLMIKGITRVDDARRVADIGVTAISGVQPRRQQPRRHPGHHPLPRGDRRRGGVTRFEVVLDGGIRRGGDVVKALALGARAVMIGRAYLWGLAANGQPGVENVLDIIRGGIDSALIGTGRASVHDLRREDVVIPPGFELALGAETVHAE